MNPWRKSLSLSNGNPDTTDGRPWYTFLHISFCSFVQSDVQEQNVQTRTNAFRLLVYEVVRHLFHCYTTRRHHLPTFDAASLEISAVRAPTRQPMPRVHALRGFRKRGTSRKATETGPVRFVFPDWSWTAWDGAYMQRSLTESTTSGSSGLSGTDNRSGPVADWPADTIIGGHTACHAVAPTMGLSEWTRQKNGKKLYFSGAPNFS